MKMHLKIGIIHFVGIGGIGMSGIAEALHKLGYKVQGSDAKDNANVKRLREQGVKIFIGHDKSNIDNAEVVVISSAIKSDNAEYRASKEQGIPIVKRAEMLAELMRFRHGIAVGGTHGKTTTTSLIATILEESHMDPTVINGGIINAYDTNARLGSGDWMVVEADESDGSFLKLPADIAVITNMDPEHLEYYGNFANLKKAFCEFVEKVPFYGFGVLCIDHDEVRDLAKKIDDRRIITYGEHEDANVRYKITSCEDGCTNFDVYINDKHNQQETVIKDLCLPMIGRHNVSNATGAIAVAIGLDIDNKHIINAIRNFKGVKRRFTYTGEWQNIKIFDDYGHHPVEISAVLKAAKQATKGKVIAISQPHRYTRLRDLFEDFARCFAAADMVLITPVYAAGEAAIENINSETLVQHILATGHKNAYYVDHDSKISKFIAENAAAGDYVVFLGAGDITKCAYNLPEQLKIYG